MNRAAIWEIPEPRSVHEVRQDDGSVTILRRHGNPAGPRLLLGHGNGLAMDFYYPFWSLLTGDFDVLLYDLRNHGWNAVGERREHNMPNLVRDQERVVDAATRRYGERPTTGVFHSLSTIIPLLSFTEPYSALVLFDPPLCRPGASQVELHTAAEQAATKIRRRGQRTAARSGRRRPPSTCRTWRRARPTKSRCEL